jgi:hypothetical protein
LTKNLRCGLVLSRKLDKNVFIAKKPSIKQEKRDMVLMKRKMSALTFILVLLLLTVVIIQFARFVGANPYFHGEPEFKEVLPPVGIEPPTISILTPENNTVYASSNITINFDVILTRDINNDGIHDMNDVKSLHDLDRVYYNSSWQSNVNNVDIPRYTFADNKVTSKYSIKIEGLPEGPQWFEIYAVGIGSYATGNEIKDRTFTVYYDRYKLTGSSMVNFTIDTTPPIISALSVENKTYSTSNVTLNVMVNEPVSQVSYSLDGQDNVTVAGNTTLTDLPEGEHNLTVCVLDLAGNTGNWETIYFSVEDPFPTTMVIAPIASVAIIGSGLLVYFKKRKKESEDKT